MEKEEFNKIIIEASITLDVREKDILVLLNYILINKRINLTQLLSKFGFPETHFKRILHFFGEVLMPTSNQVVINQEENQIFLFAKNTLLKINDINGKNIEQLLKNYKDLRPKPERKFDQFIATEETTSKRALIMAQNGDLYNRSIAFLGDDDLTSIAVGMTKQAKRIAVFEIDERISDTINKIASEAGLNIEIIKQDLRSSLSKEYLAQFDTVFTDPPYTSSGISLFINRGIELLKNKYVSRLYLCYGSSDRARERELEIQKLISEKNLVIHSKYFQFNKYYGAESIGSSSSLFLLDWTPKTKTTKINTKRFYTYE